MTNEQPNCFVFSKDLMFSSQISGAAKSAGFDTKTVLGIDQVNSDSTHYVVLDLTIPSLDIADAVRTLKDGGATVIAVGPHVHEAKLELARESGCDRVLSKGQASRELGAVLAKLSEDDPSAHD